MEEASRATGATAPAEVGFDVEIARVAVAGIKVLAGTTTLVSFEKVQGGANKKEGHFTAQSKRARCREHRVGGREYVGKQGGGERLGATAVDKGSLSLGRGDGNREGGRAARNVAVVMAPRLRG